MYKGKNTVTKLIILLLAVILLQGCGTNSGNSGNGTKPGTGTSENNSSQSQTSQPNDNSGNNPGNNSSGNDDSSQNSGSQAENSQTGTAPGQTTPQAIDLNTVKPNEAGRIMVVMFHNFVEEYKKGDKQYTTTFSEFEKLLDTLYTSGYRLISMNDYLSGKIDTPSGFLPMVFTFDDGTAGQFNLVDEGGTLKVNPQTAVGIMEKFYETHPDFGLNGTFYVNLGDQTFNGVGTVAQRLEYLKSKGFEIGNHTYSHINLKEAKTAEKIQEEIGGNQKKMYELIPGYTFTTFSLPYGAPSKELTQYVIKGEYEGIKYENKGIMEVGWDPNPSPFNKKFNPLSIHRVRASGIEPVDADLAWWLVNQKRSSQYVSDGNPDTVAVPEAAAELVDQSRLDGRKLITYQSTLP